MIATSRMTIGVACAILVGSTTFFPGQANTKDLVVDPPAADETLIYVFRKFPGYGIWIAVNDQTVSPLKKNKRHTVVRAKAGLITLNAARGGWVIGEIAIDDRPGETVYVLVSSSGFVPKYAVEEISADDAAKRLRKTKPEDSMEPLANNEYHGVLLNPGQLGFNLMQLAGDAMEPDANSAVITFFRRKEKKMVDMDIGIWGSDGFIGDLRNEEALSVRVPPGEHFFVAGRTSTSVLRAQVEAGKQYAVLEASSHGLALHRLDECQFDVGVFTTLSRDHLDFHGTMEEYKAAKGLLFQMLDEPTEKRVPRRTDLPVHQDWISEI